MNPGVRLRSPAADQATAGLGDHRRLRRVARRQRAVRDHQPGRLADRPQGTRQQQALLVGSLAPGRPLLDLTLQLASILTTLAPVALVFYLMAREGEGPSATGHRHDPPGQRPAPGARRSPRSSAASALPCTWRRSTLGISLNVVPENLPALWWRTPVLILDAVAERHPGGDPRHRVPAAAAWTSWTGHRPARSPSARCCAAPTTSTRASAHSSATRPWASCSASCTSRWRRVTPMIIAHTLIDAVAFVGYAYLHGRVSWLP